MAGGGSRGGRKVWAAAPSYYVESNNTAREDVPASDDSAEVDVRITYRPENNNHEAPPRPAPSASASRNKNPFHYDSSRDDDDVREREPASSMDRPEALDEEQQFAMALKKQGLEIVEQEGDGNCLFRAISLQVYGDASMHEEVRQRCLDFMVSCNGILFLLDRQLSTLTLFG
jgi:hypothetical protein